VKVRLKKKYVARCTHAPTGVNSIRPQAEAVRNAVFFYAICCRVEKIKIARYRMSSVSMNLKGKVAVVIGGTSGLGRAIALALAEAGADVAAPSRRSDQVESVAQEIENLGRRTLRATCDVADRASLQQLLEESLGAFGKVDILVNSAGITKRAPTLDFSEQDWNAIIDTNLSGTLRACQIFGRHLIERRSGAIINIASLASEVALYEVAAYCASKAAVTSLTQSLAVEWARYGIRVNAIAPGVVPTSLNEKLLYGTARGQELLMRIPMGRYGKPEEIAGAAVYLASDAATYVTGAMLRVDGGMLASGVNQ
jgi:NAD(P)-dependent dehydrogenase (short-subunit alcohol dehydrogenase family)